jgi:hypothetical protein
MMLEHLDQEGIAERYVISVFDPIPASLTLESGRHIFAAGVVLGGL